MGDLKERIGRGARLLAVAGAYVPAVHCHNPPPPAAADGEQTPPVASVEPAPAESSPGAGLEGDAATGGAGAVAEPAEAETPPATPPVELPARPGAGATAECRFLEQTAQAATGAPARQRRAVEETYRRFSASLGLAFEGEMGASVEGLAFEPTLRFSVSYAPTSEPWSSRYERVTVTYVLPGAGAGGGAESAEVQGSAVGHVRGGGTEPIGPAGTCRIRARDEERRDCAYPRWNPGGMRYGLFATITPEAEG